MSAIQPASTKTVDAVVARGRTVLDATGEIIKAGETAKVTPEERKELQALGFLVDPRAERVPVQQGLKITSSDGPAVRLA